VLFGDAHNGYTIAYVFAIDDPEARGGKREGRRWYAFLALFEGEREATGAWPWITRGFEQMASGLRERASMARKESVDSGTMTAKTDSPDTEHGGGLFVQPISLEQRSPSHVRTARGSFGNPEGLARRPRFGNPGGIGNLTAATIKSLGELIGLDSVDIEIHAAMGWIMSGLLGPGKDLTMGRPMDDQIDKPMPLETDGSQR
jgi:Vesicle coat protein involved in Golgi to plasma membrane transport